MVDYEYKRISLEQFLTLLADTPDDELGAKAGVDDNWGTYVDGDPKKVHAFLQENGFVCNHTVQNYDGHIFTQVFRQERVNVEVNSDINTFFATKWRKDPVACALSDELETNYSLTLVFHPSGIGDDYDLPKFRDVFINLAKRMRNDEMPFCTVTHAYPRGTQEEFKACTTYIVKCP